MKLYQSNLINEQRRESGSVLIIVLWIAIGLVSIALYFANSMTYELRAADNRVSGMDTQQAIEGAARYVGYVLYNYSTNGSVPENTQFASEAVPVGESHFWIIGRDPSELSSTDPYFGLVDESSKLNLNNAGTNTLYYLPNMTSDFTDAILDWRGTNGGGMYSMDYEGLGYADKNAPFETVDELRMVYGASMDLLVGDDRNDNGILDSNETNSTGQMQPGLLDYFTVYTREPNFTVVNGDNIMYTNVNTASQQDIQTLFQNAGVNSSYSSRIYNHLHPVTGATVTFNGILDFCAYCKGIGMSSDDFAKIYPNATTSTSTYIRGRVNINTASTTVLTALFMGIGYNQGVDQSTATSAADSILNYRQQNQGSLNNSVAWIIDALGTTSPVITALRRGDYITARTYQFSADIAAVGPYGRGYRRVKFIFDTSDGTPKIIYRRDLTQLGWALGDKARQTWVGNPSNNE
jgi:type II secretory pathway component PulK